jgi:hypothetical protein
MLYAIGVLIHGRGSRVFTVTEELAPDSNMTVEIVQRVFNLVDDTEGKLPDTVFAQFDNTSGQNKNK